MKANGLSHIRKWLWIFLLSVIFITVAIFLLIYHEINAFALTMLSKAEAGAPAGISTIWAAFRLRLLLLLSGGVIVIGGVGLMWLRIAWRRLNKPVRMIDRAVSHLAAGKLNVTVTVESADEFGKIGAGLNELAANLQELLLFIWKQSGQCLALLQKMDRSADSDPSGNTSSYDPASAAQIHDALLNLREMAESYVFYDVRLDGEQATAINEPGQALSVPEAGE
jgi:methyl-accepting chemotaxis protein